MSAAQLLQWHIEMGADEAIGDEPINRFTSTEPAPINIALPSNVPASQHSQQTEVIETVSLPTETAIEAKSLADKCEDLSELQKAVSTFTGLSIQKTASHCFFLQGNLESNLLILIEAPSSDDDRTGTLMSGDAGTLWKNILQHTKITEQDYALSPIVFWRPPGNRKPTEQEIACCAPFIEKAIQLMQPKHIIVLGAGCYNGLFNENTTINRLNDHPLSFQSIDAENSAINIPTFAFDAPTKLLKQPASKALFWKNLLKSKIFT